MRDLSAMLLSYIANPASSTRMRKSAVGCLELLSRCTGVQVATLAAAFMEKHSKELISRRWVGCGFPAAPNAVKFALTHAHTCVHTHNHAHTHSHYYTHSSTYTRTHTRTHNHAHTHSHSYTHSSTYKHTHAHTHTHVCVSLACRLLPFKNVEYTIGAAEALSFFLRLSPPVLSWGPELSAIVNDALDLAKLDEAVLIQQLPPSRCAYVLVCVRVCAYVCLCV